MFMKLKKIVNSRKCLWIWNNIKNNLKVHRFINAHELRNENKKGKQKKKQEAPKENNEGEEAARRGWRVRKTRVAYLIEWLVCGASGGFEGDRPELCVSC